LVVVPAMKLVPVMVIGVSVEPATTVAGLIELIAGADTVTAFAADTAVLVFCTVMLSEPAAASEAWGTVAVIEVAVPFVTVSAVVPR